MGDNFTKTVNNKWIQDGWEPKVGDWTDRGLITGLRFRRKTLILCDIEITQAFDPKGLIWLPTIEQLMGMVEYKNKYSLLRDIKNFLTYKGTEKWSWQELLLAFVMHKLHRLKRDGERWAK